MNTFDEYLGDGVYAFYDGYHIWLDLRGQDNVTRIGMEPAVLKRFDEYRKSLKHRIAMEQARTDENH